MRILDPKVAEDRKRQILQWMIHEHIRTTRPVSSQAIADAGDIALSPATIRNVIKELEDEGFVQQPHPSAGRVPTDKGYRLYVDYLMEMQRLAARERERIDSEYKNRIEELDHLLLHTTRMLSTLSRSIGFALSPKVEDQPLRTIELIRVGPRRLLAVLVTESGLVRHWSIETDGDPSPDRLRHLNGYLNERLRGRTLAEVGRTLHERIAAAEREYAELESLARSVLGALAVHPETDPIHFEGTHNIADSGDIEDMESLRSILRIVEDKRRFAETLETQLEEHWRGLPEEEGPEAEEARDRALVRIRIGIENELPELKGLTLISTPYRVQDRPVGLLGILGPRRMEYARMVGLVSYVSDAVNRTLREWERREEEKG